MLTKTLVGALGIALLAGTANAATIASPAPYGFAPPADTALLIDFDSPLPGTFTLTGDFAIFVGDQPGEASAPAISPVLKDPTAYLSVPQPDSTGSAELHNATQGFNRVSFLWGSIDDYNTIDLLDQAGNVIDSFSGTDVPAPAMVGGGQLGPTTNRRVYFFRDAAESQIYGIRVTSTQFAFELDNVAFAGVPEPATWAMMIGGFGLVGGAMRRRRNQSTMVTA